MRKFLLIFFLLYILPVEAAQFDCDKIRDDEKVCLACNLYHEARGETDSGIMAVAIVTLNRVRSPAYPNSICGVVWQKSQFSWTDDSQTDRIFELEKWLVVNQITRMMLDKTITVEVPNIDKDVLWYHRYDINPHWSRNMTAIAQFGNHRFFKNEN